MPVWRFRDVQDMPEAWAQNADVPVAQRIRSMMRIGNYAGPLQAPRGVTKYRSFDDLCADRLRYEQERITRIQTRKDPSSGS